MQCGTGRRPGVGGLAFSQPAGSGGPSLPAACRNWRTTGRLRPSPPSGTGGLIFFLRGRDGTGCYLEVKSVAPVEGGVALFPDAPSERGAGHMEELAAARREGFRAVVLFVVQRSDADRFRPSWARDPRSGRALSGAPRRGWRCWPAAAWSPCGRWPWTGCCRSAYIDGFLLNSGPGFSGGIINRQEKCSFAGIIKRCACREEAAINFLSEKEIY